MNAGSGVVMLHYQTRVAAIGNKSEPLSNPKCLKPMDEKYAPAQDLRNVGAGISGVALFF